MNMVCGQMWTAGTDLQGGDSTMRQLEDGKIELQQPGARFSTALLLAEIVGHGWQSDSSAEKKECWGSRGTIPLRQWGYVHRDLSHSLSARARSLGLVTRDMYWKYSSCQWNDLNFCIHITNLADRSHRVEGESLQVDHHSNKSRSYSVVLRLCWSIGGLAQTKSSMPSKGQCSLTFSSSKVRN